MHRFLEEDYFWRDEVERKMQEQSDEDVAFALLRQEKSDISARSGSSQECKTDAAYAQQLTEMVRGAAGGGVLL